MVTADAIPSEGQQRREVKWNNPDGPKISGVEHGSFRSPSMEVEVGYNVYLPPGYAGGNTRYPVVYFLHGAGGNENSDAGAFSGLVGKLIAQKQIPPVICVFPNGGMSGYLDRPDRKVMGETLIIKELLPLIDRTYRTQPEARGRRIGGFSMGGGGAIRLALKYPEFFSAAGSWAGAFGLRGLPALPTEPETLRKVAGRVRMLLVVGDQDFTRQGQPELVRSLEEAKVQVQFRLLEGVGHNLGLYHQRTGDEMVRFLAAE